MKNFLGFGEKPSEIQDYYNQNGHNPEQLLHDEAIKKSMILRMNNPRVLLMGMPGSQSNHLIENMAQYPQGPTVIDHPWAPAGIRNWINDQLKTVFAPRYVTPHLGINLIKQNLELDLPDNFKVELINYPNKKALLARLDRQYFPIIGLNVGEKDIAEAEDLVQKIQEQHLVWVGRMKSLIAERDIWSYPAKLAYIQEMRAKIFRQLLLQEDFKFETPMMFAIYEIISKFGGSMSGQILIHPELLDYSMPVIISGNYGAIKAKKHYGSGSGVLNRAGKYKTKILWNSREEQEELIKAGKIPYTGEGVHDMRAFLIQEMGIELKHQPDDKIETKGIKELPPDDNFILEYVYKKLGLKVISNERFYHPVSIGAAKECEICANFRHSETLRASLYEKPEDLANALIAQFREAKEDWINGRGNDIISDEAMFWIEDGELSGRPGSLEAISKVIKESGENLHWGINAEIADLLDYKKRNGDFMELVRGGLGVIRLAIDSKADVNQSRKGASVEEVDGLIQELQGLGIVIIGSFKIGLPIHTDGETKIQEDGQYSALNLQEDVDWFIGLKTAAQQFSVFQYHDGEENVPVNEHLEELNKNAKEKIYAENGPVSFRMLLTMWDGFMKLKDSDDPADIIQASYRYWVVRSMMHLMSLSTPLFWGRLLEPVSKEFNIRFAKCLKEIDDYKPKDNRLNKSYQKAYQKYMAGIDPLAREVGVKLRSVYVNRTIEAKLKFGDLLKKLLIKEID